jgi:glycosyltransferase involved in cell wall biosynthesis
VSSGEENRGVESRAAGGTSARAGESAREVDAHETVARESGALESAPGESAVGDSAAGESAARESAAREAALSRDENWPSFSVIVPTYNRPARLAACLSALARLDYPRARFEVVVCDDGSDAPPEEVCAGARASVEVRLVTQRNAGPSAARNAAARAACGEFFAFTDDDCEPERGWLRALAARLTRSPDRLVGGRTVNHLPRNLCSATSQLTMEVVYDYYNPDPADARFFASNNFAMRAALYRELGGFDEQFRYAEDREFCARWIARGRGMTYAPEAVVRHLHALTLRTLWRQHFGYGCGAWNYHRALAARGGAGRFKPDLRFYTKLALSPLFVARKRQAPALAALLFWSQLANLVGFASERRRARIAG